MVQVLRLLRRLPVAQKVEDIAIFINRELLPFLQELRESTAATFEQVTTNRLLGRDTPGTGDVEEISLDDTLEFTGSGVIQRAEITGDVEIPAGSNVATVPALAGIASDITAIESDVTDLQNAEFITYASNAALTAERVATTSDSVEIDLGTSGQAKWNVVLPKILTQPVSGTLNAHQLPSTLLNRDTLVFSPTSNTTLNGIDLESWPEGFEFILINNSNSFTVTINDESGSAIAEDRISTPRDQQIVLGSASSIFLRRFVTRWGLIERGWPDGSTSITYSGFELRRAALTGFAAASANSNATTSAEPIVTYSASANMSAERVLSAGTNTTISTAIANQISVNVAASDALIPDGDKGDITVSGTGSTWTVDNDAITMAKLNSDVTLAGILANGNTTDANDIHVSANQQLVFDAGGDGLGDIQSLGTLTVRTASTLDMRASTGNVGMVASAGNCNFSGTAQLNFTASTGFVRFQTTGVNRFRFNNDGSFGVGSGNDVGTAGELFISQGATTPIWGQAVTASYTDASVTLPKLATQGARTVVSNNTLSTASPTDVPHTDLIIRPDLLDCFVGGQASTTLPNSALGWNYRDIVGTGIIARVSGSGSDGVYRITTGSNAGDAHGFTLGINSTHQVISQTQFKYTEFRIQPNSAADIRFQIGYMQAASTATTGGSSGVFFLFDSSVSANWITTTRNSSVSTSKTSGTAVGTGAVIRLGIATDTDTTVRFYVNDSLVATHSILENIPTNDMNVGFRVEALAASAKQVSISRFTAIRRLDGRSIPEV